MKRVFIDSSVLFAAAYSNKGYARDLILLGIQKKLQLVISTLVIEETRRNLADFAPETIPALEEIFELIPFEIADPTIEEVLEAANQVVIKDAPILASAKLGHVDILATLDKRHFLDHPELEEFLAGKILKPIDAYKLILTKE